ncbi:MAG: signal peptidase I [Thermoflexales bacterium]
MSHHLHSETQPPAAPRGFVARALREIVETIAIFAIVFVIARATIGNYSILGQSMEPNYHQDQRILVDKITPRLFGYNRGDVVVVHSPVQEVELIKRVIGKPGDVVELINGKVVVNGQQLVEPYLPPNTTSNPMDAVSRWELGEDEYFVMGDNRNFSQDSRIFGPVTGDLIVGRALILYWPLSDFQLIPQGGTQ